MRYMYPIAFGIAIALAGSFLLYLLLGGVSTETPKARMSFVETGHIEIRYGANENDNWSLFSSSDTAQQYHRDVRTEYMRVWISSQWYRESTIPLQPDGTWDFTNTDLFINSALASGAVPFVVFAHAPGTFGEGYGESPPISDKEFAIYVGKTVQHFSDMCKHGKYYSKCDVNGWYFEIWNEPFGDEWWDGENPRYPKLFNEVKPRIKEIAPAAKVGGLGLWFFPEEENEDLDKFLSQSSPDFVTLHHYGNIQFKYATENKKMDDIKALAYDNVLGLRKFLNERSGESIEIIEGEYNSDYTSRYMPHLDEKFTAAWYASALIWHIKSQEVLIEMFYSGTSLDEESGFGMWSSNLERWPVYYMKEQFVKVNKRGSRILEIDYNEGDIDALFIENSEGMFLTLVNKRDKQVFAVIETGGLGLKDLSDYALHSPVDGTVSLLLEPYEVRFFSLVA